MKSFIFWTAALYTLTASYANAGVIVSEAHRWPSTTIPYVLDCNSVPPDTCDLIDHTIKNVWNRQSPIKFTEKTDADQAYVDFILDPDLPPGAALADIGYQGKKVHWVRYQTDVGLPLILHEMGHVAGLLHEHSHCMRDQFLIVQPQSIPEDRRFFVDEISKFSCLPIINSKGARMTTGGYDIISIMHYPQITPEHLVFFDLTAEGRRVLAELKINAAQIGDQFKLSDGDIASLRELYGLN